MQTTFFTKQHIQIIEEASDWKDAVRLSLKPLLDTGCVKACYAEGVIRNTLEFGPYYMILPGVALIHGRPEQGAEQSALAVTRFRKPVDFGLDSAPVRVLIAMSATDSDSHMEDMRALSFILTDEALVEKVMNASSTEEIYEVFTSAGTDPEKS